MPNMAACVIVAHVSPIIGFSMLISPIRKKPSSAVGPAMFMIRFSSRAGAKIEVVCMVTCMPKACLMNCEAALIMKRLGTP